MIGDSQIDPMIGDIPGVIYGNSGPAAVAVAVPAVPGAVTWLIRPLISLL